MAQGVGKRSVQTKPLRWIKEPRQHRSRQKLHRILDATERLLERRAFDDISVAEIMTEAGASTGLFYTRFANKDALLNALYERHMRELHATGSQMLDPRRWADAPLEVFVRAFIAFAVRLHREKRGLLRTLVLRSHARPDGRYRDAEERNRSTLMRVARIVAAKKNEVRHANPRLAGALGYLMVLGALREKILFGEGVASAMRISDRRLTDELTEAYLAYLGATAGARPRPARPAGRRASRRGT